MRDAVSAHIVSRYSVSVPVVVEKPPNSEFGEIGLPVCFSLAKPLRRAPRQIAEELVAELPPIEGIAGIEVAGGGFLNVRIDRVVFAELVRDGAGEVQPDHTEKVVVEHTNINPNKAAHIGHLRNAVLGDTLVRMMRTLGHTVEVQNYIDNTGVQVADVAVGFHYLEKKSVADVAALAADPGVKFDYLCWDLYARISQYYGENEEAKPWRADTLHSIEAGEGDLAEMGRVVADAIVERHLRTMGRLDIDYDVLPRESEILYLQFWASAFEQLKERKAIYLESDGKNEGCWVMPAELFQAPKKDSAPKKKKKKEKEESAEPQKEIEESKVIVRSNGTVTYVGKDIAYQLWKFGLLGKDFHYQPHGKNLAGETLWVSSTEPNPDATPSFGKGDRVYNVIDVRQSYLQDVVRAGLQALGYEKEAENSIHFSYEMVALSPRCCADLGIPLSEEDQRKAYVEVSGRKGLGVKADDLIDMLIERALEEVRTRHEGAPEERLREIATPIALGALRYFMLKFTRNTVIAFDLQEALSFEGETGPYVQYARVRANNILRKFTEGGRELPDFSAMLGREALERQLENEDFWQVLLEASRFEWTIDRASAAGEPAQVARYAFQLAQLFNNFYHQHHILHEEDAEKQAFLLWMTRYFLSELERVLKVMGIPAPEVM